MWWKQKERACFNLVSNKADKKLTYSQSMLSSYVPAILQKGLLNFDYFNRNVLYLKFKKINQL